MAFDEEAVATPAAIGDISILLHENCTFDEGEPVYTRKISFRILVLDQDNQRMEKRAGNLWGHLTTAQRTSLQNFMDAIRIQAVDEMLPGDPPE